MLPLRIIRPLAGHARAVGMDIVTAFTTLDMDPRALFEHDACGRPQQIYGLWQHVLRHTGDPLLGLRATAMIDMHLLELSAEYPLPQLFFSAATVGEAFAATKQIVKRNYDTELTIQITKSRAAAVFRSADDAPRAFSEQVVSMVYRMIQHAVSGTKPKVLVSFAHATDAPRNAHSEWFGTEVSFGAPETALWFDEAVLRLPLRTANAKLHDKARKEQGVTAAALETSIAQRVRDAIAAQLAGTLPGIDEVARALDVSPRTLKRRLQNEATTFRALLDEVRSQTAARLLTESERPLKEVAQVLGFSEPSAFHRAFVRWFGQPPTSFRNDNK